MKRLSALVAVVAWVLSVTVVLATPGSGATSAILADATFDPIATSQTAGLESVIQEVTIAPGGHTGWHTHPGGTVVLVESGTFTMNHADCTVTTVAAGRGIVESGGQVQLAQNLSTTDALVLTVVYFDVPVGGAFRTDATPAPVCPGVPATATGLNVTAAPVLDRATFANGSAITGVDERRVVVQSATFAPGGHSGWHSHPGATVIYVVSGTFSFYPAETCQRQQFTAGQGVIEQGGGVQLARNESTTEPLVLFVVYFDVPLTPAGAFRIDEPEPATCTGLAAVPTATPAPTAATVPDTSATVVVEPSGLAATAVAGLMTLASVGLFVGLGIRARSRRG
jgi:quercetin dioxygenase-like cupin family protein